MQWLKSFQVESPSAFIAFHFGKAANARECGRGRSFHPFGVVQQTYPAAPWPPPMSFVRSSVLLILVSSVCSHAGAFPPLPTFDRHGDPLPVGAIGRLGTAQLRAPCDHLAFTADGRSLVGTTQGSVVRVWDARTGSLAEVRPLPGPADGSFLARSVSADGRTLAVSRGRTIDVFDLPSGRLLGTHRPNPHDSIRRLAVSDDRRLILFADRAGWRPPAVRGGFNLDEPIAHLVLWNTTTGTGRTLAEDESGVVALAFAPDGKRAVSSGGMSPSRTRVWDTATGQKLWEVPDYNAEKCQFTPDGKYLIAAPGGGQRAWHVWDAATGKPAAGLKPPTVGYAWTFAVSPDGHQLLIPTHTDYVVWDLKAGAVERRWPGANQSGRGAFAPDGRSVVTHDTVLRRRDLSSGKNLYADVAALGHVAAVRRVFFTPDGRRLVSIGDDRTARVWDVATTQQVRTIPIEPATVDAWAVTPDGSALVGIDDRLTVHRWPLAEGRPKTTVDLRDAQKLDIGLRAREAHVLPDGTLAVLAWPRLPEYRLNRFSFSFWDLQTGRLLRWGGDPGNDYRADYTRLSPDGRLAAGAEAVHDTRTGARRPVPPSPFGTGGVPLFSPDARLLVGATARDTRVWEVATGRVIADLPITTLDVAASAPDGRRLASAYGNWVAVWDVGLRSKLADRPAPARIETMVFSPNGRTLATGHADGTILLWPVPAPVPDGRWSESEASSTWDALADDLPANVYPALWQLTDYPAEAVQFLRRKAALHAAAGPDEFANLVAGLDSGRFADREAATKKLRELGRAAEGPLRQALKRAPSAEQVARIEALLAGLEPAARPRGDDLRAIRAVAVLEAIGTPEARQVLAEWADRGSPPRLADEAERALARLRAGQ
jgi:WD40 repeat protein